VDVVIFVSSCSKSCFKLKSCWLRSRNDREVLTVSSGTSCRSPYSGGVALGGFSQEREGRGHLGECGRERNVEGGGMFIPTCRKAEHYLWKLDRTENYSRMRMRLARNYNFNRHEDASHLRDTGQTVAETPSKDKATELLAKVTKRSSTSWDEEEVLYEQLWSDANSPSIRPEGGEELGGVASIKERKLIKGAECHLIMLMDNIPGHLEITSKHLYFLSDQGEKNQSQTCELELGLEG
jgi:hypothetical protein